MTDTPEQPGQYNTAETGYPRQDSQNKKKLGQIRRDRSAGKGQIGTARIYFNIYLFNTGIGFKGI
jgi:hypothetical protein